MARDQKIYETNNYGGGVLVDRTTELPVGFTAQGVDQYMVIPVADPLTGGITNLTAAGRDVMADLGIGGAGAWIVVGNADPTGAIDSLAAIQSTLDSCGVAGGGIVYLPCGSFKVSNVLLIPSNVVLVGAGMLATKLISPAGQLPGKSANGGLTYATISMIGVANAGVRDLTIDHATNSAWCNGVQIGSATGTLSTDCSVERIRLLGFDSHQYLVWNYRATGTVINDNVVIGNMAPNSVTDMQGIEVYGGHNIRIIGNTLSSVGGGGAILVWEDEIPGSTTDFSNIIIGQNIIDGGRNGISINPVTTAKNIIAAGNVLSNQTRSGVSLTSTTAAILENISIDGNAINNQVLYGIELNGAGSTAWKDVLITGNAVFTITGAGGRGVSISSASNVNISGNTIKGSSGYSAVLEGASKILISGNVFDGAAQHGIDIVGSSSEVTVKGNKIFGYGTTTGYGVHVGPADRVQVVSNIFRFGGSETEAVYSTGTNTTVSGNVPDYIPGFQTPFYNQGSGAVANTFWGSKDNNGNIKSASFIGRVDIAAGYANTNVSPFSLSQFWNNAAVAFDGIVLSISDYGSAAGSKLLQILGGAGGATSYFAIAKDGKIGIGTATPKSALHVVGLPVYASNAAAITGGLTAGAFYRSSADPDLVCVVH